MPKKPVVAFQVTDVPTSMAFYTKLPGFTLAESPAQDIAYILDPDNDPFLLLGPQAGDAAQYLAERHFILKPGERLNFVYPNLEMMQAVLQQPGMKDAHIIERCWGGHTLILQDPDGFVLEFITRAERSSEESLSLYMQCVPELEKALLNLSEDDLNRSLTADSWSIRRIVHHLADSETIFCWWMKLALSESGRTFVQYFPSNNDPLSGLSSPTRPIEPSLDVIRAMHAHIAQLAQSLPDALERYTVDEEGNKVTFRDLISIILAHTAEHLDEIEAIRHEHHVEG